MNSSRFKKLFAVAFFVVLLFSFVCLRQETGKVPVLNYHMVEDGLPSRISVSTQDFEEQMAYLHRRGYTSITPDQLLRHIKSGAPLPDKPVVITFDDGYADNFTNAYPIMQKYGFTGTIFVISDFVENNPRYLTWKQIKELHDHGFVIGSHTLSHVPLTNLSEQEAVHQLVKSREGIEWRLNTPVRYFAYPTGAFNQNIEGIVARSGYSAAFTVDFGRVSAESDVYAFERIPIFKSRLSLLNFYLRMEATPVAGLIQDVKRKVVSALGLRRHDDDGMN